MRGQAFVVFKEQETADKALKELQGLMLYNKPLTIQYSNTKSDAVAKLDGTWDEHKRKRDEEKERRKDEPRVPLSKKQAVARAMGIDQSGASAQGGYQAGIPEAYLMPNKILFIQNLPEEATAEMLEALFNQYDGFKEVRLVPSKKDLAFVEYETEMQAGMAKQALHKFKMKGDHDGIDVPFARR
ncbi:MAG: U2 small nuclear ribonucleoprotein B [Olpidium bornovanus]|uniref:U2 small nuclear ribonucleoprotein B n=1 Tax=Olpidium bornovanus TaxID=278681 RepID=A0A8H7ZTL8_9FUNG|nr:MAG: U2 small nuclear ribonucleoprotein B [Olpidium bornovanus]